jgi:hypothetical protein
MKRRELDSSGKSCRNAHAGSAERPANTRSVEKLDQTKRNMITPTNEEVYLTHQKSQSEMKRRELDSCGKVCG